MKRCKLLEPPIIKYSYRVIESWSEMDRTSIITKIGKSWVDGTAYCLSSCALGRVRSYENECILVNNLLSRAPKLEAILFQFYFSNWMSRFISPSVHNLIGKAFFKKTTLTLSKVSPPKKNFHCIIRCGGI